MAFSCTKKRQVLIPEQIPTCIFFLAPLWTFSCMRKPQESIPEQIPTCFFFFSGPTLGFHACESPRSLFQNKFLHVESSFLPSCLVRICCVSAVLWLPVLRSRQQFGQMDSDPLPDFFRIQVHVGGVALQWLTERLCNGLCYGLGVE